ncbi:MAG: M14 family metallopeptidase [Bacteroidota bacterium]
MQKHLSYLILLLLISFSLKSQDSTWLTHYEKSDFKETPRYKETIEYSKKLARNSEWIHYKTFGESPQNRKLPLLIVNKDKKFTPEKINDSGKVTLLVEACIHPGEPDGKDAGLMLLRDIAIEKKYSDLLDNVTLLFIPIFNVDGHERFGPYNRINQNGPKEMGWRTTAQNLNLNRDFLKADAPEMKNWLKMFNKWMPDFFIDIHTTNGADYQYPITYAMEIFGNMDAGLTKWQKNTYLEEIKEEMQQAGHPIFPYISFREWHNPESGIVAWAAEPRLSQGYTAVQNRPGLLIETHMLKDYKTRVTATYEMLIQTLEILNKEKRNLHTLIKKADSISASKAFREKPFPLEFQATDDSTIVEFKGIEYEKVHSDLTGSNWFKYGDKPVTKEMPYFNDIKAVKTGLLPECYLIPPEWNSVIKRLKLHGVKTFKLNKKKKLKINSYLFTNVNFNKEPFEGRHRIKSFDFESYNKIEEFPEGTVIVPMNQSKSRLIAHILEPESPDSYVKWGFFNAIFEQKEYAELYVMEKMAREMLEKDSSLRNEFKEKKKEDEDFANSPWAISNWFYKKTPYWDERKNNYPVAKIYDENLFDELLEENK